MKAFYSTPNATPAPLAGESLEIMAHPRTLFARLAVYDSLAAAPRVEDLSATEPRAFVESVAATTYRLACEAGGDIPYTVIREVVENLIHAQFREVVVTILDSGHTIRFSDQGPGISDKERVFLPGFSTATEQMKRVIRGVGSGLPIVREYLTFSGGSITIDDNLGTGTVVTIHVDQPSFSTPRPPDRDSGAAPAPRLSLRQKQVISLVMELGSAGPSVVSRELKVGLSTAYRDLAALEQYGLIESDDSGKRTLTSTGAQLLDQILHE